VRRARSNTPLQALTTLNEPSVPGIGAGAGLKTLDEGGATDRAAPQLRHRGACSRASLPPRKRSELLGLLEKEQQAFADGWHDPLAFEPAVPNNVTPAQAAAWTAVTRVLLNLDETITKE
jgi:hypothetical protein